MGDKKKVIFVDDNQDYLNLMEEELESLDYEWKGILQTPNLDVLDQLAAEKPDLIFLDVMFAKGFSTGLASRIRANEVLKDVPVYLMSFLDLAEIEAIANKNEVNGCFMKPVEQEDMKDLFVEHFQMNITFIDEE